MWNYCNTFFFSENIANSILIRNYLIWITVPKFKKKNRYFEQNYLKKKKSNFPTTFFNRRLFNSHLVHRSFYLKSTIVTNRQQVMTTNNEQQNHEHKMEPWNHSVNRQYLCSQRFIVCLHRALSKCLPHIWTFLSRKQNWNGHEERTENNMYVDRVMCFRK